LFWYIGDEDFYQIREMQRRGNFAAKVAEQGSIIGMVAVDTVIDQVRYQFFQWKKRNTELLGSKYLVGRNCYPVSSKKINMFCFLREQGQGSVMWRASGNGLRDKANTPVLLSEKVGGV